MSGPREDGGPAFPVAPDIRDDGVMIACVAQGHDGMTLRDYFAAKALIAIYALTPGSDKELANHAYRVADAMLAARSA